jgi:Spy/CpxP family protein refolding chaperone
MRIQLILTAAVASLALTSAPALAGQSKSSAAPAAAANTTATKAEKKVCRRYEKPGSHRSEKICLTRAQWDKIEREG